MCSVTFMFLDIPKWFEIKLQFLRGGVLREKNMLGFRKNKSCEDFTKTNVTHQQGGHLVTSNSPIHGDTPRVNQLPQGIQMTKFGGIGF